MTTSSRQGKRIDVERIGTVVTLWHTFHRDTNGERTDGYQITELTPKEAETLAVDLLMVAKRARDAAAAVTPESAAP